MRDSAMNPLLVAHNMGSSRLTRHANACVGLRAAALAALCCCVVPTFTRGAEERVEDGAPLVRNGGFEEADADVAGKPTGWDLPDALGVQWTNAPGDGHGLAIRMNTAVSEQAMVDQWKRAGITKWDIPKPTSDAVAGAYGLSFYSDAMPVASGQAYRVQFDYRGPSGGAKVWIRGYGLFRGRERRRYETIVNCRVENEPWQHFSQAFHPTRLRPDVTSIRVMLYAYWPPGVYWFDNVNIAPVSDAEYDADRNENRN